MTVDHIGKHSISGNLCLPLLKKSGNFMWSGKWSPVKFFTPLCPSHLIVSARWWWWWWWWWCTHKQSVYCLLKRISYMRPFYKHSSSLLIQCVQKQSTVFLHYFRKFWHSFITSLFTQTTLLTHFTKHSDLIYGGSSFCREITLLM